MNTWSLLKTNTNTRGEVNGISLMIFISLAGLLAFITHFEEGISQNMVWKQFECKLCKNLMYSELPYFTE